MRHRRSALLALGVFVAAAIAATWPLASRMGRATAGGDTDPMLVSTVLAWDADRFAHGLRGFWDAPWLFPYRHSLAYSEHLIGVALFTAPMQWLTGNQFLTYNAAYIASYVLAGFGMFLLTRELWGRDDAAVLAGLAFELTPYRLAQTSHLQVLMNGWMPIGLLALHRYFASGSRSWLAAFAAVFVVLGLSNGYYLYFFALPVAVVIGVEMAWRTSALPRRRMLMDLTAAGLAIALAIAPTAWVYYRLQQEHGFTRTIDQLGLSAGVADYFHVSAGAWNWWGLLPLGKGELELFHGFVVLSFAAIGVVTIGVHGRMRLVTTYVAIAVLAAWLAMGPGPATPYGLLFKLLPGFSALRVPARITSVFIVAVAVVAGAGFAWLLARLSRRSAAVAAVIIAATILVEGQHGVGLTDTPSLKDKSWDAVAYDWLKASPPGAAIELNVTQLDDVRPFTIAYQFHALSHRHPIVNGYGGWKSSLQELFGSYASPLHEPGLAADALRGLRMIGVRYVLLHASTFATQDEAARTVDGVRSAGDQIEEAREWPGVWAWRLKDLPEASPAPDSRLRALDPRTLTVRASGHEDRVPLMFDGDIDTRWISGDPQDGGEWIEIRFPREVDLARVRFETAPRSVTDYPRRLAIVSADAAGSATTIFAGTVADRFIAALATDELFAPVIIDLPRNRTATLRIQQAGRGTNWWSVHELGLWERAEEKPQQPHDGHQPAADQPATLMTGLGRLHHPIATSSPDAQRFFDQGLTLVYAFNHDEAVRSFRRAAELDPAAAMPHWGIALALGPNINDYDVDAAREKAAFDEAQRARTLVAPAPAHERAYIDALVERYSIEPSADLKAMAVRYKDAMRELTRRYPDDLDAATLYAESLMDLHPWMLWSADGKPTEGTEEIVATLESVLRRDPMHIGANHYYIHAVEASKTPGRALASASRLETLVPDAGHLVHMPAHIYMRTGNYEGAVASNAKAAEVDREYIKMRGANGLYPMMYYNHNLDFLASAAMMSGQFKEAKNAAGMVVANATPMIPAMAALEPFAAKTLYVLLRFARWDDVMALQPPDRAHLILTALWHFGRGVAQAARGNEDDTVNERDLYAAARKAIAPDYAWGYNQAKDMLAITDAVLDAWIARATRHDDAAIESWRRAVAAEDALNYNEPADWFYPTRESLGAALLRAHRADEAARAFRDDLERNPGNGRSLFGLWQTQLSKKDPGAAATEKQYRAAWKKADVSLRMSDF